MKKAVFSLVLFLSFLAVADLFIYANKDSDDSNFQRELVNGYKVFSLNIPKDLNFAGEKVPINNFDVRESFDRELVQNVYYQSQTLMCMKRVHRWFPIIEPILQRNGIPSDFKYLAIIESNLTNVVSPAGATGFWQILEATGKQYGLEVNEEVDERYDVERSTVAACKYFKEAYSVLGNWTLVAASYNMGITGVRKQVEMQKTQNYYELYLNQETARYVFRLLVMKEILHHPQKYGYRVRKKDLYPSIPTTIINVNGGVSNLAEWALEKGYSYKILKLFNPWLRKPQLTNKDNKTYAIKMPEKGYTSYEKLLPLLIENREDSLNYYNTTDSLFIE